MTGTCDRCGKRREIDDSPMGICGRCAFIEDSKARTVAAMVRLENADRERNQRIDAAAMLKLIRSGL